MTQQVKIRLRIRRPRKERVVVGPVRRSQRSIRPISDSTIRVTLMARGAEFEEAAASHAVAVAVAVGEEAQHVSLLGYAVLCAASNRRISGSSDTGTVMTA